MAFGLSFFFVLCSAKPRIAIQEYRSVMLLNALTSPGGALFCGNQINGAVIFNLVLRANALSTFRNKDVCRGLRPSRGIAVARDDKLYTGGEAGQIYRIAGDGKTTENIANTGGSCLGITLDREENIYVCDKGNRQIVKVTQRGDINIVAGSVGSRRLTCPNFSVFDSRGNLYFSDSGARKECNGIVYRAFPDGRVETFAHGPFHFANGIALDARERFLYVAESNLDRVLRLQINADGSSGAPEVFVDGLARIPDGLAFDANRNLYVATYGSNAIYRVSLEGHAELLCVDDECAVLCQATNCAFGGPDFDQIFVSNLGASHISQLDLRTKGQPLWHLGRGIAT
jgi:gluconolactonase